VKTVVAVVVVVTAVKVAKAVPEAAAPQSPFSLAKI
jgi:hypothetical protein